MNRFRTSAIFISLALFLPITISADTIPTVSVTDTCTVTDTEGNPHSYSGQFLGICALAAAKDQGAVLSYTLENFSFGLFLQSINDMTAGATQFWSISQNGAEAMVGLSDMTIVSGDLLSFQLIDWTDNSTVGLPVQFRIGVLTSSTSNSGSSSSGGGEYLEDRVFNVPSALEFLVKKQKSDGSFASPMQTDWAAIAFGVANDAVCNDMCRAARERLRTHLRSASSSTSSATDVERHIMGLEALGIDPHTSSGAPVDALVSFFDGTQMGEKSLVNDDIFALFPLLHAGYSKTDAMIETILDFVLFKQKPNGSWEESVDLTAAAIQALKLFPERTEAAAAIGKAKEYLKRNQDNSGIFGRSSFTLSWVLQAIASLGETPQDWEKSGVTPLGYLGILQQDDGGVEPTSVSIDTRVWATSYAIPAAFGKPWDSILGRFSRPLSIPPPLPATTTVTTSSLQAQTPAPDVQADMVVSRSARPEPLLASGNESGTATTSEAATTSARSQSAAAAEQTTETGIWVWLGGLGLILGATFYFFRRV